MLLFALISVLNLILGFAAAVMLGYGPRPWWILFADRASVGTVRIEKLEDEPPAADEATVDTDDEEEESDDGDLEEEDDDENEDADTKEAQLQEINAEKLAKRLEEEQRRALAKEAKGRAEKQETTAKQQLPPKAEPKAAAEAEAAALAREDVNDDGDGDLSSLVDKEPPETTTDDEVASLLRQAEPAVDTYDADESLDEIESLLQAAGQLEAESSETAPVEDVEDKAAAEPVVAAEKTEAEPANSELSAAEIEAMFNS
ncbi:hypothetical protein [Blastopirellula marina]|uniref:Uncharacterized protein n=1 Tax=Blastopirellula marina DSM 3645 TaxID=314230 RepID=A3ZSU9_9BACT|nr:hypothetical protein [Blastopirellula marina]EAQ80374.1 hypothetical protein DSM3645_11032 [Blastopirellula marina DSM 3645]